jgi:hypothetical protein
MRKVCLILLGLLLAFAGNAYAADINDVSSEKWLDHVSQMQVMRQQILNLLTRENPTAKDREMLSALQKSFAEKKAEWDQYLQDVADGKTQVKEEKTEKKSFCSDCGKMLCDCGKGYLCKKCGKKVCDCKKACDADCKGHKKHYKKSKKGVYHRYDKRPRKHFKKEYHRYNKRHKDCKDCGDKAKDCSWKPKKAHKACADKAADCSWKQKKAHKGCAHYAKKRKMIKKSDCATCPSKCASKIEVKCNGGVDCPSCPNYKTPRCCKVSGKCSSHKEGKTMKKMAGPMCRELKLMGINKKCSKCAK